MSFIKRCLLLALCTMTVLACLSPISANSYAAAQAPEAEPVKAADEEVKVQESTAVAETYSARSKWPVSVWLNGKEMELRVPTQLKDGTTYVAITDFCRVMGCERSWGKGGFNADRGDELHIECMPGNFYLLANGRTVLMGKECYLDGELMVPIRAMATVFDMTVTWDGKEKRVYLEGGGLLKSGDEFYDENALYWLSRIINAEARGESLIGQIAVGNVVLNRVKSKDYPDTIYGVIFDKKNGVQFTPTVDGSIYLKPYESCIIAAKLCLEGVKDYSNGALYFISNKVQSCYAMKYCQKVATIGGHRFYA